MATTDLNLEALWNPLRADAPRQEGVVHDWMGSRWPEGTFPALPEPSWLGPELPWEGDGFRAGPLEWAALAVALRVAARDECPATAVEMGASQAPWCLAWIRGHRRLALTSPARAHAFEAAAGTAVARRFWLAQGLEDARVDDVPDGLRIHGQGWEVNWHQQAVSVGGGEVLFPDVDIATDNGAQAVHEAAGTDYRGQQQTWRRVPAVDPATVVTGLGRVHLLHLDIQGGEEELLRTDGFWSVRDVVSVLMLGTHSRAAEALAFDVLPAAGFVLLDEEPCLYRVLTGVPRLVRDGEQLWVSVEALEALQRDGLLRDMGLIPVARKRRDTAGEGPVVASAAATAAGRISARLRLRLSALKH